jgi:hypothetical protein
MWTLKERVAMMSKQMVTGLVLASLMLQMTGCSRRALPTSADAGATPAVEQPAAPTPGGVGGPTTPPPGTNYPGDSDGDMKTDMPTVPDPDAFPDPPPARQNPAPQGTTSFEAKAVAHTTYFNLPVQPYVKGTFCHINLTWQPVLGTKEFWVYKGTNLPTKEAANRDTAYRVVPAGVLGGGSFTDGTTPPSLQGGNFLDKVKRLGSALLIRPGMKQSYKVIAVDENGTPFAESPIVDTTPMLPAASPILKPVLDRESVKPLFSWTDSLMEGQAAVEPQNEPDGYYISVFPSFLSNAGAIQAPGSVAGWATYRPKTVKLARYGEENITSPPYPGTLPFGMSIPLRMGGTYAWTVISVKTDSGNMLNAKAVSKSWGMIQNFTLGADPAQPASGSTGSSTTPSTSSGGSSTGTSASSVVSTASSILDKIKNIFKK